LHRLAYAALGAAGLYTLSGGLTVAGRYLYPGVVWALAWALAFALTRFSGWRPPSLSPRAAWVAAVGWGALIFATQLAELRSLRAGPYELGIYHQVVWNAWHHGDLYSSFREGRSLLGEHWQPIVLAYAPLYALLPHPATLLLAQTLALILGMWPLLRLLSARFGAAIPAVLPLAYLAYAPIRGPATFNFHPEVMSIPLFLWLLWAIEARRFVLAGALASLALTFKEHVPLVVAGLGFLLAWRERGAPRALGAAMSVVGLAWFYLAVAHWIPDAQGRAAMHHLSSRYAHLGASPAEIITHVATRPWVVLVAVSSRLDYVLKLLAPLAFLPLLRPYWALAALPTLVMNVLSSYGPQSSVNFQYTAEIAPFLIFALIDGFAAAERRISRAKLQLAIAVGLTVLMERPETHSLRRSLEEAPRARAVLAALPEIAPDAAVSATPGLATHLAARRHVHLFPELHDAEWVLIERGGERYGWHASPEDEARVEASLLDLGYRRVVDTPEASAYRRAR